MSSRTSKHRGVRGDSDDEDDRRKDTTTGSRSRAEAQPSAPLISAFIPGENIELTAFMFYVSKFVDKHAGIQMGRHWQNKHVQGFWMKSRFTLNGDDILAIKLDSRDWWNEEKALESRGYPQILYIESATAKRRLQNGRAKGPAARAQNDDNSDQKITQGLFPEVKYTDAKYTESQRSNMDTAARAMSNMSIKASQPINMDSVRTVQGTQASKVPLSTPATTYQDVDRGMSTSSNRHAKKESEPTTQYYGPQDIKAPKHPTSTGAPGFSSMTATAGAQNDKNWTLSGSYPSRSYPS